MRTKAVTRRRCIRRLPAAALNQYRCYLCGGGADSFLEAQEVAAETQLGAPNGWQPLYSLSLCRYCIYSHGMKELASEWNGGPIERLHDEDPQLQIAMAMEGLHGKTFATGRDNDTEETPDMWTGAGIPFSFQPP